MTCKDCKHFQKTQIKYSDGQSLYDCPYANDWCEEDDEINTLCDDRFESINEEQREYDILYESTYNPDDGSM